MGQKLCCNNNTEDNTVQNVFNININSYIIIQLSNNQKNITSINENQPQSEFFAQTISTSPNAQEAKDPQNPKIKNILLKNQALKIQSAFRNYKKRSGYSNYNNQSISHYTNDNANTESGTNKIEYIGARDSRGLKQGFGIQKMQNGKFRGIFTNDKVTGWGIYEHKDGDVYRGEYENDRTCGFGEYSHGNGAVYYGYWNDDVQFGIGYEEWSDSSQYSGEYNNGKKDGIGTYLWQDKTMYQGEWKNNNIEGYGIYKYVDGRQYSGQWKNNQMHGYGEFIWVEGKKYIGFYKNDKKEGFGIYYWPSNRFFVGFWKQGKQNGVGKYVKDDQAKYGIWKDGKREKWFDNEDEFVNYLEPKDEKFIFAFQCNKNKLKKYMELDFSDEEESDYDNNMKDNETIKEFKNKKGESEEEKEED